MTIHWDEGCPWTTNLFILIPSFSTYTWQKNNLSSTLKTYYPHWPGHVKANPWVLNLPHPATHLCIADAQQQHRHDGHRQQREAHRGHGRADHGTAGGRGEDHLPAAAAIRLAPWGAPRASPWMNKGKQGEKWELNQLESKKMISDIIKSQLFTSNESNQQSYNGKSHVNSI